MRAALPVALLLSGAAAGDSVPPGLPEALAEYRTWPAGPVHSLSNGLDGLCRPLTPTEETQRSWDARRDHGPHARRFMRVYANPLAASAFAEAGPFPIGSIVAKEKRASADDPEPYAVAFMIKRAESERPESGGWEFRFFPERPAGSLQGCVECHRAGGTKDFVFTRLPLS